MTQPGTLEPSWLILVCLVCLGLCTAGEAARFYGWRALGNSLLILATLFSVASSAALLYVAQL